MLKNGKKRTWLGDSIHSPWSRHCQPLKASTKLTKITEFLTMCLLPCSLLPQEKQKILGVCNSYGDHPSDSRRLYELKQDEPGHPDQTQGLPQWRYGQQSDLWGEFQYVVRQLTSLGYCLFQLLFLNLYSSLFSMLSNATCHCLIAEVQGLC